MNEYYYLLIVFSALAFDMCVAVFPLEISTRFVRQVFGYKKICGILHL